MTYLVLSFNMHDIYYYCDFCQTLELTGFLSLRDQGEAAIYIFPTVNNVRPKIHFALMSMWNKAKRIEWDLDSPESVD